MEEYTTDSSGNEFSAVAGILDAFYGATDIAWVSPPSQFNYGVYYDRINASGGIYQPRHALTVDDAGGLKSLYDTNTLAMEYNPHNLVAPADYVGGVQAAYNQQNSLLTSSGGRSPTWVMRSDSSFASKFYISKSETFGVSHEKSGWDCLG